MTSNTFGRYLEGSGLTQTTHTPRRCEECGWEIEAFGHGLGCSMPEKIRLAALKARPLWKRIIDRVVEAHNSPDEP